MSSGTQMPQRAGTDPAQVLRDEANDARAELARADTKAFALLGGLLGLLTIGGAAVMTVTMPVAAQVAGGLALASGMASAVLAVLVVRPGLSGSAGLLRHRGGAGGRVEHAVTVAGDSRQRWSELAEDADQLAVLAVRKYRLVRASVDVLLVAAALTAAAVVLAFSYR